MRSVEEIMKEWDRCRRGGPLTITGTTGREWVISNSDWVLKLKSEYEETLTLEERVAIIMHSKFCRRSHSDQCNFNAEKIDGIKHEFSASDHRMWLKRAKVYLDSLPDDMSPEHIIAALSPL